jgi:NADH-quinone oxidoreductase subunit H
MLEAVLVNLVKIAGALLGLLGIVAYTTLLERRLCAWIQDRVGPNRVGPLGLLQPIADFLKLLAKEDILPPYTKRFYYTLAPILVMLPPLLIVGVIPWGSYLGQVKCVVADVDIGLLFALAASSLAVYGIVLAGWASNSKYPFLGGIRSGAQMISYEVCLSLSVVSLIMQTSTLNLGRIVEYQAHNGWLLLYQPLAFAIFLVSLFAETNRLPFDFPEAEQELAGGYNIEYSSLKFALFYMGEYANVVIASMLLTTLFLGGWSLPFSPFDAPAQTLWVGLAHIGIFLGKVVLGICFFIWVRWTLPRFRYDQLMWLGWNALLPLAILNIIATGVVLLWRG